MPHTIFSPGAQTTTIDSAIGNRQLIPGIEPGGSRAGHPMKPAVLLKKAWIEITAFDFLASTTALGYLIFLKMSSERLLDPGLILPVAEVASQVNEVSAVGQRVGNLIINDLWEFEGTVWVPGWMGVRFIEIGTAATITVHLHLLWEPIEVPWVEWFHMWEFLDGITNNAREY